MIKTSSPSFAKKSPREAHGNRQADGGHLDLQQSDMSCPPGIFSIMADVCEAFWCVSCVLWLNLCNLYYYHSFSCFFAKIFLLSNRLTVSRLMSYCLSSQLTSHVSRLSSHAPSPKAILIAFAPRQEGAMASPSRSLT